jgi:parallel beta-helix repeat protein
MYLINPPHSALLPNARFKHKILLLAAGISVYAIVLLRECNTQAIAQAGSTPPTSRIAQRPTAQADEAQTQTTLWVNPQTGNDAKADGGEQAPYRTLTQALQAARSNTIIQLSPGTYSSETGEVFPIVLKAGVTVQGNPNSLGQGTVIRGGGTHASPTLGRQNVTLVGANQATLTGVTVTNPQSRGHGLWVEAGSPTIRDNTFISSTNAGMVALGSSVATVQNNLFVLNRMGGLVISGHAQPDVRSNIFQRTGAGITVGEDAAPQLVGNRISQNRDGIIVQGNAHPIIRDNAIEDSDRDGIVVIAQAQPDLGTANAPGNNTFLNNRQHDINALATSQTLPAFGNQLTNQQVAGTVDLTGTAPLVRVTTVASTASRLPATQINRASASASASRVSTPQTSTPAPTLISSLPPSSTSNPVTPPSTGSRVTQPAFTSIASEARASEARASRAVAQPITNQRSGSQSGSQSVEISVPPPQVAVRSSVPQPQSQVSQPAIEISVPPAERPNAVSRPRANVSSRAANVRPIAHRAQSASLPTPAATPARAIEIAVPSPEQNTAVNTTAPIAAPQLASVVVAPAASLPRQSVAMVRSTVPRVGGSPISIPVPPPEVKVNPPTPPETASTTGNVRILPVPADEIPVGNTGDLARIGVGGSTDATLLASRRESLQYRVVVEAEDEQTQSLVQSLVPGAFVTSVQGQSVVQIGAFSSHDNAQEAIQMLSQAGLRGIIQPME